MKNKLLFVITQPIVLTLIVLVLMALGLWVGYSKMEVPIAARPTPKTTLTPTFRLFPMATPTVIIEASAETPFITAPSPLPNNATSTRAAHSAAIESVSDTRTAEARQSTATRGHTSVPFTPEAVATTKSLATTPIDGGRIAFVSKRDGNEEIYVMNADGSDVTRRTSSPYAELHPSWGPNGRHIAFTGYEYENLSIMDLEEGNGVTRLTDHSYGPSWSPDGSHIAFTSERNGDVNKQIYVLKVDYYKPERLTDSVGDKYNPAWSPNDTLIAFAHHLNAIDPDSDPTPDSRLDIFVMNVDGSKVTNLTNSPAWDDSPAWSPDGSRIAFTSNRSGNFEIYLMNPDGSELKKLTNNPAHDADPCWSPDGLRIAFESERDGYRDIYVMNADGSGVTRLTNNSARDEDPSWGPR